MTASGGDMAPDVKHEGAADGTPFDDVLTIQAVWTRMLESEINELRRVNRKWEIAYLLVCAQFAVVAVAAIWGWAR